MAPNINHHIPPGQATEVSKAGKGGEAWWAGGRLSRSLPAGEGAEAGRACRQLSPGSGAHRGYALIFRPEARRKRPFRSQQCGFLCSREAGSHPRRESRQPSKAGVGQGLGLGCSAPPLQVTYRPLPSMVLSPSSQAAGLALLCGGIVDTRGLRWGSWAPWSFGLTGSLARGLHLAGSLAFPGS